MTDTLSGGKWYREPYVWLVISIPITAVIAGTVTAWLAVRSDDGLVADDYYRQGLEINKTLARDQAAGSYALEAQVAFDQEKKLLHVTLRGNDQFHVPETITLTFLHPTRGGLDRRVMLRRVSGAIYEAALPELPAHHWYLQIEADDWRIMQTLYTVKH